MSKLKKESKHKEKNIKVQYWESTFSFNISTSESIHTSLCFY